MTGRSRCQSDLKKLLDGQIDVDGMVRPANRGAVPRSQEQTRGRARQLTPALAASVPDGGEWKNSATELKEPAPIGHVFPYETG
jgi:hypothetical protein